MSKRQPSKRSISTEEAREAVRNFRYDVAGIFQPDAEEVSRLLNQFESMDYVVITDFLRLVIDSERSTLSKLNQLDSPYITGVTFEVARTFILSLLRIPPVQRDINHASGDQEQTQAEIENLRAQIRSAAKIASEIARATEHDGAPPSLEVINRMIQRTSDPSAVRIQLEAARAGDPPITFNDNQQMPVVLPMPKCLLSEHKYKVEIMVNGLNDPKCEAEVTVLRLLDTEEVPIALEGLIGVPTRANFIADKRGKVRRALLGAQLTNKSIALSIEVTRGFRTWDAKYNVFTIGRLLENQDLVSAVEQIATQLKLDFAS